MGFPFASSIEQITKRLGVNNMSLPVEETRCDECRELISWGEYHYSMTHFKRCIQRGNGLCWNDQKKQREVEMPKKLADFVNKFV